MMTGGVAKNKGITNALEEKLGAKLYICDEAQLCGALGAALFAYEKCKQGEQVSVKQHINKKQQEKESENFC